MNLSFKAIIIAIIAVVIIYLLWSKLIKVESMVDRGEAQKIVAGMKYVAQRGLKFDEFKKYIGEPNFPFTVYSDFRVKNMVGKLDEDYVMNNYTM